MPDYTKTRVQIRRGTTAEWEAADPVYLGEGELAYVSDAALLKVGDGVTEFGSLNSIGSFAISVSSDYDPVLNGDLKLNNNNIVGNGNINIGVGGVDLDDGNVVVSGDITCNGTITNNGSAVATIEDTRVKANHCTLGSSDISNWVPPVQADVLRVTTTADVNIHGLSTSYYNKNQLTVSNNGPHAVTFANDSATATSDNRFYNIPSEDMVLASGETIVMTYDDSYSRWLNYTVSRATRIVQLTQAEYDDASFVVDPNTVYVIV